VARHQHFHERLGGLVAVAAVDQHLVDVARVEVADRALDEVALLVDEGGGGRFEGEFANLVPEAQEIFEIALDLGLRALAAGGAHDYAHAFRHFEIAHQILEAAPVGHAGDLARHAAAARRVRHQHAIAAGEGDVSGERRALVAALFLGHLHQHDLAAFDDLLNLVVAVRPGAALGRLFDLVAAQGLDGDAACAALGVNIGILGGRGQGRLAARLAILGRPRRMRIEAFRLRLGEALRLGLVMRCIAPRKGLVRLRRIGRRVEFGDRRLFQPVGLGLWRVRFVALGEMRAGLGPGVRLFVLGEEARFGLGAADHVGGRLLGEALGKALAGRARILGVVLDITLLERVLGGLRRAVVLKGGAPVGDRDAVVIGMDFAEGEEAVAVAAIFDEGRLERGFDPRHLGEVNIAFDLFFSRCLEIEFFEAMAVENDDPGLFRVRRVDEHALCHWGRLQGARRRPREERAALS